jgi:hypothetical protein
LIQKPQPPATLGTLEAPAQATMACRCRDRSLAEAGSAMVRPCIGVALAIIISWIEGSATQSQE